MNTVYKITLANGYQTEVVVTISQPSYYALEYASKIAKVQGSEVLSVEPK